MCSGVPPRSAEKERNRKAGTDRGEAYPLVVMSAPRGITKEEYDSFARFLTARVMRGAVRA